MLLDEFECQESHLVRARVHACARACVRACMCAQACVCAFARVCAQKRRAQRATYSCRTAHRAQLSRASLPAISEKNCPVVSRLAFSRLAFSRLARHNMQASLPALRNCEKYWVVQTRLAVSECGLPFVAVGPVRRCTGRTGRSAATPATADARTHSLVRANAQMCTYTRMRALS